MPPPPLPTPGQPQPKGLSLGHASLLFAILPIMGRMLRSRSGQAISGDIAFYWVVISAVLAALAAGTGIAALIRASPGRGFAVLGLGLGLLQLTVHLAMLFG